MNLNELTSSIHFKKSFLCVGLDTDVSVLPQHILSTADPVFEFNKEIIDATKDFCVAYKLNTAFYESLGVYGWTSLTKTVEYIRSAAPEMFIIADAKRGDIGNTSKMYAKAFFETMDCDAVTVNPYMGEDSVKPFLEYKNKWIIVLALTSNKGASDFQTVTVQTAKSKKTEPLFEKVLHDSQKWGSPDNMMYVTGATRAEMLKDIRIIVPDHFLLVPGVGAQGGSLDEVVKNGMNNQCGLLVNSSRGIIYAGNGTDFAEKAAGEAEKIKLEMENWLKK